MTLPRFLDAAYALWMEENLRIKPLQDFFTLSEVIMPSNAKVERAVPKAEVQAKNKEAMAALEGMLQGVHGVKRRPRKR